MPNKPTADTDPLAGLKRYIIRYSDEAVEQQPDGKLVAFSDVAALVAAKDAEIERLRVALEVVKEAGLMGRLEELEGDDEQIDLRTG